MLVLERQVLVFPLLVVLLACTSFLFGGQCAEWQWWGAVVAVVIAPFLKKGGWRVALGAAGLFAGLLIVIKGFLPPLFWDNAKCEDVQVYHLPMIQLLIEGWNPVADPLAEGITAKLGLDLWGMAPLHVAYLPKTMAVFAAVAYQFVRDPTALTIPGLALLWLGVALQAMRLARRRTRWMVLGALIWILPLVFLRMFIDLSLAFASCGLLLTMADNLKRKRCDWLALIVWTVWMTNIKLNGVLAAFVFWVFFALNQTWHGREKWVHWVGRFAVVMTGVMVAWGLISWNPLITSWKTTGHPLYPFATVDEELWPVRDLTWDLQVVNDDLKKLGRIGLWMHEYVSPGLVGKYVQAKTGQTDFAPRRIMMSPVHWSNWEKRLMIWAVFIALLMHPRGRMWGVAGLLLTWTVSLDKIGFDRYLPWMSSLGCLAVFLWAESIDERWPPHPHFWEKLALGGVSVLVGASWMWHASRDIAFKALELVACRENVRYRFCFWPEYRNPELLEIPPKGFVPRYNYLTAMANQCQLLFREWGKDDKIYVLPPDGWRPLFGERQAKMVACPLWQWDERQWFVNESERDERMLPELGTPWYDGNVWDGVPKVDGADGWIMTPWLYYYVPWGGQTEHIIAYYSGGERRQGEGWGTWLARRIGTVTRIWSMTYPREVGKWLCGRRD